MLSKHQRIEAKRRVGYITDMPSPLQNIVSEVRVNSRVKHAGETSFVFTKTFPIFHFYFTTPSLVTAKTFE